MPIEIPPAPRADQASEYRRKIDELREKHQGAKRSKTSLIERMNQSKLLVPFSVVVCVLGVVLLLASFLIIEFPNGAFAKGIKVILTLLSVGVE